MHFLFQVFPKKLPSWPTVATTTRKRISKSNRIPKRPRLATNCFLHLRNTFLIISLCCASWLTIQQWLLNHNNRPIKQCILSHLDRMILTIQVNTNSLFKRRVHLLVVMNEAPVTVNNWLIKKISIQFLNLQQLVT